MEEGYFSAEIDQLKLTFSQNYEKELQLRVIIEIINGVNVFRWTKNGESKFSTDDFKPVKEQQIDENSSGGASYLYGFDSLFVRSNFVELNPDVLNGLSSAILSVRVVIPGESAAAAPAPAKGAKGAPAAAIAAPTEEVLFNIKVPLSSLFGNPTGVLSFNGVLADYIGGSDNAAGVRDLHSLIDPARTSFDVKIFSDNALGEYVLGSRIINWNSAVLLSPPHTWTLHAPDVLDPKAKVQPTAADLRAKYLENVGKLIETQSKVASFTLSIGGISTSSASEDENNESEAILKMFPSLTLSEGKISFDRDVASSVAIEEDIRLRGDLWSIRWSYSSPLFLHRSQARKLAALIANDPAHSYLPLTVKKIPTAESVAVEGGELFATALLDLSAIVQPGENIAEIPISLQGDLMDESQTRAVVTFAANRALVDPSPLTAINAQTKQNSTIGSGSSKQVSSTSNNRDALQELRDEIAQTLEKIAQEYVSMYPVSPAEMAANQAAEAAAKGEAADDAPTPQEDPKTKFVQFLISNGLFHDMQESLRPKVQLLIKERYGSKGRAIGRSAVMKEIDSHPEKASASVDEQTIQSVLSELYAFIMKECNIVLNSMFSSTIIQKDVKEVDNPARINDEEETDKQICARLLLQALDAAADQRFAVADNLHLERLQVIDHSVVLGSDKAVIHEAYTQYAIFNMQRSARVVYSNSDDVDEYRSLQRKAREALAVAYARLPNSWETSLLYASVLIESDQQELGEHILQQVLACQLPDGLNDLNNFDDLSGYESDKLCPVHPRCYAVLAGLFSLQNRPLLSRKALLMANRSYEEGSYGTPTSEHGKPRRTLVLILAETSIYLSQYGQFKLAGACADLALDCENASTEKASARNKVAITPPHVKYLLKRALAERAWGMASASDEGIDVAAQAALVAVDPLDQVAAKLCEAKALARSRVNQERAVDAYLSAIEVAVSKIPISDAVAGKVIPLDAFLTVGKVLISSGQTAEAVKVLLYGAQLHESSSLCLLLGNSYMRLDRLDEAEQALLEANMLDNRNADVWAYLCVACIARGPFRVYEAEQCLFQALRLGQSDVTVLRELANAFVSIDKLQIAEDLIRRAIAAESAHNSGANARKGAYNRKLLADILAGQNLAAKAVEEYKQVLTDDDVDTATKLAAAQKCSELVVSLGREEELTALEQIIAALSGDDENSLLAQ